jgi:hypothetical protein
MKKTNRFPNTSLRELVTRYNKSLQKWKDKRDELQRKLSIAEQELSTALAQLTENNTLDDVCSVEECRKRRDAAERRVANHDKKRPFQRIKDEANMALFDERDRDEFYQKINTLH